MRTSGSAPQRTRCARTGPPTCTYLQGLGTDPPRQGEGLGSAVLQPVLARCDRDGLPAYLETTKERNVGFYESHGFAVVARTRLPLDGPPMWFMWREPAESRTAG
jgi:GNAT superfamily N-acetyltransferase